MKPSIFMHSFDCKNTICKEFGISEDSLKDCHVFLAYYHVGSWGCDSSAYVLFERGGELFEVHGAHCSCHGLEEQTYSGGSTQWEPELVTAGYLAHQMSHNGSDCGLFDCGGYDDEVELARNACETVVSYIVNNQQA